MKLLNNVNEAKVLNNIVEHRTGSIWLENSKGVRYDLASRMTRDILFAEILTGYADDYEIYASTREDISALIHFFGARAAA